MPEMLNFHTAHQLFCLPFGKTSDFSVVYGSQKSHEVVLDYFELDLDYSRRWSRVVGSPPRRLFAFNRAN